jgi:hypothetical protein
MKNHEDQEFGPDLFERLIWLSARSRRQIEPDPIAMTVYRGHELRKMKKFRFQLLHQWLVAHVQPCRVADIAGGKGMLAYLLQRDQWTATVIDPLNQGLPDKYKDIATGKRVKIPALDQVRRLDQPFEASLGRHFDLLVGMHAHGCNAKVIEAASEFGCGFLLFPCCVIDEPFYPPLGVQWLESVTDYAVRLGHPVYPFRLNFKGQNIGLFSPGCCPLRERQA